MLSKGETKVPWKAMGTGFGQNVRPIPTAQTDWGASVGCKRALPSMPAGGAPRHGAASGGRQGKGQSSRQNVRAMPTFREAVSTDCRKRPLAAPTHSRQATTGRHTARNRSRKAKAGPWKANSRPWKAKAGSAKIITGGAMLQVENSPFREQILSFSVRKDLRPTTYYL